jgi:hypothetical protein
LLIEESKVIETALLTFDLNFELLFNLFEGRVRVCLQVFGYPLQHTTLPLPLIYWCHAILRESPLDFSLGYNTPTMLENQAPFEAITKTVAKNLRRFTNRYYTS